MKYFSDRASLLARQQLRLELARMQSKLDLMPKQCVIFSGNTLLSKDIESIVPGHTLDIASQISSFDSYIDIIDKLIFKFPARLAILVLDLSDLGQPSGPFDPAIDNFGRHARRLIARLQRHSVNALISDVTPTIIGGENTSNHIQVAYSRSLKQSC